MDKVRIFNTVLVGFVLTIFLCVGRLLEAPPPHPRLTSALVELGNFKDSFGKLL